MSKLFDELAEMMSRLRGEKGCPWDKEQTHETLKTYLIEESYEVLEAIDTKDPKHLSEELGDLLFQIIFHAQIAKEKGDFSIEEVLRGIIGKMRGRHPHVFENAAMRSVEGVINEWEKNKIKERGKPLESHLDGVPSSFPALMKAQKVQKKASQVGFDWKREKEVVDKFAEEWLEFKKALNQRDRTAIEDEMGDLFFTLVNLSRVLKLDAEHVLLRSIEKFMNRFKLMEKEAKEKGLVLENLSEDEMNQLWLHAKKG